MNSEPNSRSESRLVAALNWTLKTIIRLLLAALLLIALAAVVQFALDGVERRLARLDQRIDLFDSDVDTLMKADREQRDSLSDLRSESGSQESQIAGLESALERQQELLESLESQAAAMESRVAAAVAGSDTISQSIVLLGDGLVALQGDLNENGSRVDELGGQMDALQAESASLEREVAGLSETVAAPSEEVGRLEGALTLFRLWQLVSRARLRLLEDNPGLAAADVRRALDEMRSFPAGSSRPSTAGAGNPLAAVEARLNLAMGSLPADPAAAARDLEAAWEAIDDLLVVALGLEPVEEEALLESAASVVTGTLTSTLTLTSTQSLTATGTLTSTLAQPEGTPAPTPTPGG